MSLTFSDATKADREEVVELWRKAGLVVPHNDPNRDFDFALSGESSTVLIARNAGQVIAAALVGHDGHRGWPYYVAVDPDCQGKGYGRELMLALELWWKARGVPKANLQIRETNEKVRDFYAALGWEVEPRIGMSKKLPDGPPIGLGTVETKVTSLEMLERPTRPALHPPANVRTALIRAEKPTAAFYRYLYSRVGEDWTWTARRMLNDEKLLAIIHDERVEIYVLYVNGEPAGYGEIDRRDGHENTELGYFGLMPEFIGLGVGKYLLNSIVDLAWDGGAKRFWVHTCDLDHPRAIGLYQRAGFVPFDQYVEELEDPRLVGLPLPKRREASAEPPAVHLTTGDHSVTPLRRD